MVEVQGFMKIVDHNNNNNNNNIQRRAIRCEFELVGLTMFKGSLDAWWGLLPTL